MVIFHSYVNLPEGTNTHQSSPINGLNPTLCGQRWLENPQLTTTARWGHLMLSQPIHRSIHYLSGKPQWFLVYTPVCPHEIPLSRIIDRLYLPFYITDISQFSAACIPFLGWLLVSDIQLFHVFCWWTPRHPTRRLQIITIDHH